jgi:hypothetical protein
MIAASPSTSVSPYGCNGGGWVPVPIEGFGASVWGGTSLLWLSGMLVVATGLWGLMSRARQR